MALTDVEPPAPFLGQHNSEVLRELLGYDEQQIAALSKAGVLMAEPMRSSTPISS
jgi:crotonobetainyl-CoA:carnitine CoA-transferase CaiB-like acyl-CoA transferase